MKTTIDGEVFEIPVDWFLGYMVECTPTGYYWPPITYYGPHKRMWTVYEEYKSKLLFRSIDPIKEKI